ncbi:DUF3782 domain-containing protein [Thermosynechococcus sp. QS41]|uniref:PD-(D/E)XK nuclease family protein n=1 Tax=unclassified Thermosynechococcus TaxID=2622553 RepID=UPI00285D43EC|nr:MULTISPECIES: DUF3782 domain-containing protein [unclassified Thermosynechococcus]MDR5639773.1 DUF3782 domain-containing protein [Thermosynechococcus sp. PP42]WNC61180.1 DUF3782 domain-containing protein [Thermosynechococcus sp. QS41]
MEREEIIALIQRELPQLVAQDPSLRDFILRTVLDVSLPRREADIKFDRILTELQRDREEQSRRWQEQAKRWEEQDRKWHEQLAEIRRLDKRFDSTIGALGARWGIASETSFRNALAGILTESFGVEVLNLTLYDHEGEVFGRPDQVELDLIIKNGLTIACEIKSSIDKAGMYIFDRKVNFYARHHQRQIDRKIVISPMVDPRARPVAEALGIELYSYADSVEGL